MEGKPTDWPVQWSSCNTCNGTGEITEHDGDCSHCNGSGWIGGIFGQDCPKKTIRVCPTCDGKKGYYETNNDGK